METEAILQPITSEAAWRGDELIQQGGWVYQLSDEQVSELEVLGRRFVEENPDMRYVQASDYPVTSCEAAVKEWLYQVDQGRGFILVRGLRSHLYSDALSGAIYYLLGLHMGEPIRQNELGDLLDHVYATQPKDLNDPTAYSKSITDKLPFHSDSSDLVALMCLRPSKAGGTSSLVSGAYIYNEILKRRPDLAPLLLEPFHWDWKRQDHDAPANTYESPIVSFEDGVFSMYAGSLYIFTAQEYPGVPKLTPEQVELLELFEKITYEPGVCIDMDFRPGDIQWLSNHLVLHSRTAYIDYPEPQRRRHLLRLWLQEHTPRKTVPGFGKNVVQPRDSHRDDSVADNLGHFFITEAAVPREIE